MSSFSRTEFSTKLGRANNTQECITGLSRWIVSRKSHLEEIVDLWGMEFFERLERLDKIESRTSQRLVLLYIVNDVIQMTKPKFGTFYSDAFAPKLLPAVALYLRTASPSMRVKVERMAKIWNERGILRPALMEKVELIVKSQGEFEPRSDDPVFRLGIASASSTPRMQRQASVNSHKSHTSTTSNKELDLTGGDQVGVYKGILESDDEGEDGADHVADHFKAARLVNSLDMFGLQKQVSPEITQLLGEIDQFEFAAIDDELIWEKIEQLQNTIASFEKQEGWGPQNDVGKEEQQQQEEQGNKENGDDSKTEDSSKMDNKDDDQYEIKLVDEEIFLEFQKAKELLKSYQEAATKAQEREENMESKFSEMIEQSSNEVGATMELSETLASKRKTIRAFARIVFDENVARKKRRMEELAKQQEEEEKLQQERKRREEEARIQKSQEEKMSKQNAESLASAFLSAFKKPQGGDEDPPRLAPPPGGSKPALSASMLNSLSLAFSGTGGGDRRSLPPPPPPSAAYQNQYHQPPPSYDNRPYYPPPPGGVPPPPGGVPPPPYGNSGYPPPPPPGGGGGYGDHHHQRPPQYHHQQQPAPYNYGGRNYDGGNRRGRGRGNHNNDYNGRRPAR